MHLINETPLAAHLSRIILDPQRMIGAVVAKATYVASPTTMEFSAALSTIQVSPAPGNLDHDLGIRRGAIDVLIDGHAVARDHRRIAQSVAGIEIGSFTRHVLVHGARQWRRWLGRLGPSMPEPFTEVPLAWEQAYGGSPVVRGLRVPHPDNPVGKGYHPSPAELHGTELPQIEDPQVPIASPDDQPRPVNFAALPAQSRFRLESAIDPEAPVERPLPTIYNRAHPHHRMPLGSIQGPTPVRVFGCTPQGAWQFMLPWDELHAWVVVGRDEWRLPLHLDTLVFTPDQRSVSLCYRAAFKYPYTRAVARSVRLLRR